MESQSQLLHRQIITTAALASILVSFSTFWPTVGNASCFGCEGKGFQPGLDSSSDGSTSPCDKLDIGNVTDNHHLDNHSPNNAVDDNLNTSWTASNTDSWIKIDLGDQKNLCRVDIDWQSNDLIPGATILVSNDGLAFRNLTPDNQTRVTFVYREYKVTDTEYNVTGQTRYLMIKINNNIDSSAMGIREINVMGY